MQIDGVEQGHGSSGSGPDYSAAQLCQFTTGNLPDPKPMSPVDDDEISIGILRAADIYTRAIC